MGRNGILFLGVSVVAGAGNTAMSLTAAIWVATLTGSSGLAAMAGLFVFAPTLLGPLLGTLTDRVPPKPLLVATNLVLAGLLATLVRVSDAGDVWHVFAVMLAYGVAYVLVDAAEARLLVAALPAAALGGLNGARLGAQEATKLLAPLLGAGLFVLAGGVAVALLAAGTLAASAGLYLLIRPRTPAAVPSVAASDRRLWTDVVAGLRWLWSSAAVRRPVLVASVAMFSSGLGTAALYAVVDRALHRPPAFLGVLSSVQGGASIVGGLLVGRLLTRLGARVNGLGAEGRLALLGAAVFALGALAQATGALPAVVAGSLLVGLGLPWTVVAAFTAVQRQTPADLVGRVTGSATTLVFAPPALGIPLGALLVSTLDYRLPLLLAMVGAAVVAMATASVGAQRREPQPQD